MTNVLIQIINILYYAIVVLIFARILLSFVNFGSYEIRNFIFRLTETVLAPIRNVLPQTGGLDFSPLILLLGIGLLRRLLISFLV
jgi:YggT family protein